MKSFEKEMKDMMDSLGRRDRFGDLPVDGNTVPNDLLVRIRQNEPTLTTLHLEFYDLDDEQINIVCEAMKGNTHVKKIIINAPHKNIAHGRLSARSALFLSRLNIDNLLIGNQPIGDQGMKFLAQSQSIKQMTILGCKITSSGAIHFLKNESLHRLLLEVDHWENISSTEFDDQMEQVYARNKERVHPGSLSDFNQERHIQKIADTVVRVIEQDNPERLSRLILQLPNGVNSQVNQSSLLMWCVTHSAVNCLEYLLKAGVLLEQHEREYTALFEAAEEGKLDVVCLLLPYCANLTGEFYFNCEKPISAVASKLLNEFFGFFMGNNSRKSRLDQSFARMLDQFLKRWAECLTSHAKAGQVFWQQVSLEDDLLYQFPMYVATILSEFKPTADEIQAVERMKAYSCIYKLLRKKEGIVTGKHPIDYPKYYSDLECKIEDHQVETPVRNIPLTRLREEDLEGYIEELNDNLSTLEESDIDWEAYPNLFIAEFRGVHYFPEYCSEEQIEDDLRTCHLNRFAPAPAVMMMTNLFPRQLQVARESMILDSNYRLRDKVEDFRQTGQVRVFGKNYANAQFALQEKTTNDYNGFNAAVSQGANEYCLVLKNMNARGYITYAMSDFPKHALRYGLNLKNYQNNIYADGGGDNRLNSSSPRYDSNGKPWRRFYGKVYISLFTPLQMAQHRMIHVAGAHNRRKVNIDETKVPERETGSPGGVNQSCLFYEGILEVPDFSQPWTQEFVEKFNIDETLHSQYRARFLRNIDIDAVTKDLMEHIVKHKTKQLFDIAVQEAKRRGGYLIFKHYLGQYGLLPEGIRRGDHIPDDPYKYELEVIRPSFDEQFSSERRETTNPRGLRMFGQVKRAREVGGSSGSGVFKREKRDEVRLSLTMTDPGYWYSVHDGICLLRRLRSQFDLLEEVQLDRNHPYRQNTQNIFLADPYHHSNFENYLNDDISRLTASGEFQGIQPWTQMPTMIVIPILSGAHWIKVHVLLDYKNLKVNIFWNDPFGNSTMINAHQRQFGDALKRGCLRLMQFQNPRLRLSLDRIVFDEQISLIDQQGYGINGSDCGVIVFSNIGDTVTQRNPSIPSYDTEGHAEIIRHQREVDSAIVGSDALDDESISGKRVARLKSDQDKYRQSRLAEKHQSVSDQQILREIQGWAPESIDIFFGYLDIYGTLESAYDEFQSDMTAEYEPRSEFVPQ